MLNQLGYSNVRDYRGGLADWVESGEVLETAAAAPVAQNSSPIGPPLSVSADGYVGRVPARVLSRGRWADSVAGLVDQLTTLQLFLLWIGTVVFCGVAFWLGALVGEHGLIEAGAPIGADLRGLANALYFSFVTATSLGYGDIVPVGFARALSVSEAVVALLIFGAVISKFVSHRQDELVSEIHRVTFDERLDRVQTNLHTVISELLSIISLCEARSMPLPRVSARLDSAVLLFLGELRTTHDLLYQPRLLVEEGVLASILANLSSALEVLLEALTCLPADFTRSQPLELTINIVTSLSKDICGTCVPHDYTPRLIFWMDRIQQTANRIQ